MRAERRQFVGINCPFLKPEVLMKKIIWIALMVSPIAIACAQALASEPASSPVAAASGATPASAGDVEALRQHVQSLTETVKGLQQQVKDQQAALEKANITGTPALPQSAETPATASAATSPAPKSSPPSLF